MSDMQPSALELLSRPGIDVVAGGGSPLEARLIEAAGFAAVYVSGYAVAASIYGVPDIGIVGSGHNVANVAAIREVVSVPVIVDADTGYGDVVNVRDTIRRLERAGANAIQIEDQAWPKKCGHMAGKKVIPQAEMLDKIHAALDSRVSESTAIIARTDARGPLGIQEALDRAASYSEAGADAILVDAPQSIDELRLVAALPGTQLANMSEGGLTPIISADELGEIGFGIALFPTTALRVGALAMQLFLAELRRTGDSRGHLDKMMTLDELNEVVGLSALGEFEDRVTRADVPV
ncbi:MAG: oxaloacetate decarboxylase [Aeromicrobium sp.]